MRKQEYGSFVRLLGHNLPKEEIKIGLDKVVDSFLETMDFSGLGYVHNIQIVMREDTIREDSTVYYDEVNVTTIGWKVEVDVDE